jgi:hypothetical protein
MPNYQQQQNREPQSSREGATSAPNQDAGQRTDSTQTPTSTQGTRGAGTSGGTESASNESRQGKSEQGEGFAERAGRAVEQYKSTAIERLGSAREQAESTLDAQRHHVTDRIQRVGDLLRGASEQLRHEDETVARYMDVASVRVERVAQYINNADFSSLADDINRFARERPAWVIGGSFLAGLAIARFLKSTAPSTERRSSESFAYSKTGSRSYPGQSQGYSSPAYGPASSAQRSSYGQSPGYTTQPSGATEGQGYRPTSGPESTQAKSYGSSASYPQAYTSNTQESQATPKSSTTPSSTVSSAESTKSQSQSAAESTKSQSAAESTKSTPSSSSAATSVGTTQKVGFPQGQNPSTRKGES